MWKNEVVAILRKKEATWTMAINTEKDKKKMEQICVTYA